MSCLHNDTISLNSRPTFPLDLHSYHYDKMYNMKKVWIYKLNNVKGWWIGWYESGKRKSKALPSKELAEHFKQIKYTQLNSDIFTGLVSVNWEQMVSEYIEAKKSRELPKKSFMKIHCRYVTLSGLLVNVTQDRLLKQPSTNLYFKEVLK